MALLEKHILYNVFIIAFGILVLILWILIYSIGQINKKYLNILLISNTILFLVDIVLFGVFDGLIKDK